MIAVAGAGIGGLAAAIALQRAGADVVVYERAQTLAPAGAGLSLWPNAVRALRALGVTLEGSALPGAGGLHRWDGTPLAVDSPEAIEARYGAPLALVHRADLQDALLAALAPGTVRCGAAVAGFAQDRGGVDLSIAGGEAARAELLIGADGLRSSVAEALFGDGEPRDSGLVAYRAVVEADPGVAGEFWGPGYVFGIAPLPGGRVYWYASQPAGAEVPLADAFAEWAEPIPSLIAATPSEALLEHRLYDRPPRRRWTDERAGLLGDAAHPMLPFLGQGACQALEDAVALGDAVAEHGAGPAALTAYERARRPRATALVKRSRAAGRVAHLRRGWQRALRDAAVRRTPASARHRQLDAVIG